MLIIVLVLTWAALVVVLYAGSVWFQPFLYSEPAPQLSWGAPAAGTALALLLAGWCWFDVRDPEKYDALFRFSTREETKYDDIWVEKDNKQLVQYHKSLVPQGTRPPRTEYRETNPPYRVWSRSDAIIVKDKDQQIRFEAERDRDKNYKIPQGKSLRYVDARGRFMTEEYPGIVTNERWGIFLANLGLNLLHFLLWFLCLWLLTRYQWSHALGLAFVFWVIMTVLIVPILVDRANESGRKRQQDAIQTQRAGEGKS